MNTYLNISEIINLKREKVLKERQSFGPRVIVVGSTQSGKSTLCKILLNYAARLGWKPIFCDLDLGKNEISGPGTVSATIVKEYYPVS